MSPETSLVGTAIATGIRSGRPRALAYAPPSPSKKSPSALACCLRPSASEHIVCCSSIGANRAPSASGTSSSLTIWSVAPDAGTFTKSEYIVAPSSAWLIARCGTPASTSFS